MKSLLFILSFSLFSSAAIAGSNDYQSYTCLGRVSDVEFRYDVLYNWGTQYKSRLTVKYRTGEVRSNPWKTVSSMKWKFEVDSLWPQYKVYMFRNRETVLDIAVVDPVTSTQIDGAYDELKCSRNN
jgi:hypothetical protein